MISLMYVACTETLTMELPPFYLFKKIIKKARCSNEVRRQPDGDPQKLMPIVYLQTKGH